MTKKEKDLIIRKYIEEYKEATCPLVKNRIYTKHLHKFFNTIINGVFKNFGIMGYENIDINVDDLRQETTLKIHLKIISNPDLSKLKSITDYAFIISRNCVVDFLRKSKTFRNYHSLLVDEGEEGEFNLFREYLYSS